jgi:uncharacterized protein YneF (UPF0154 family)
MTKRVVVLTAMVAGSLHVSSPSALAQAGRDPSQARAAQVAPVVDTLVLQHSAHAKLVCVACHNGLDPKATPYRGKAEPVACLRCHADAQFKHAFHPEIARAIRGGTEPRVTCKDCHGTHDVASPKVAGSKFSEGRVTESCGKCHAKEVESYAGSVHGKALAASAKGAPTCIACHPPNVTIAGGSADSLSVKAAQARVCESCHLDGTEARDRVSPSTALVPDWDRSGHGARLQHGDAAAANCVSCHGSHGIRKKSEPGSSVGKDSIAGTCAKCHVAIEQSFNRSVHGLARTSAKTDSMSCATCHGEHAKLGPADAQSGVARKPVAAQACARCHAAVAFAGDYGIASGRFKSFSDSYHGLTARDGTVEAANCASCHTPHDVRPKNDTTSSVNLANRAANCGKCHRGANERFDIGPVHGAPGARVSAVRAWLLPVGVVLIGGVAGGFFFGWTRRKRA